MLFEDMVVYLFKILESGYNIFVVALYVVEFGVDFVWWKEFVDYKWLRKFLIDIFVFFYVLFNKVSGWGKVLFVIEIYLNFLVFRKFIEKLDLDMVFNVNIFIIV